MSPYLSVGVEEPLDQGDIIDSCPLFRLLPTQDTVDLESPPTGWRSRIVVLTQAFYLANSKTSKVLVAAAHFAQDLVDQGALKGSTIRDQVRRGSVFGWYFLPANDASSSLPESIVDLRELHTVSRFVLERLIANGLRRGRIATPYREHPAQHFAVTYMRIGLPEPYESRP